MKKLSAEEVGDAIDWAVTFALGYGIGSRSWTNGAGIFVTAIIVRLVMTSIRKTLFEKSEAPS